MRALATHELTKDFAVGFWRARRYRALDGLSLEVDAGEVFGFLGPNGAGKTTTLKLLMRLVFPTSGDAELLGRPLGDLSAKRRIGYLPEHPYFYDYLTAEELLMYFAGLFGLRGADRRARVSRLLDEVGIGGERRLQLRKFSKGMLQRVGIAQALLNEPDLVIFDEPMSGLDPLGRRDVRSLILRLRDRGCTVFFSSHVLSDAEALCSRVAILAKGRLRAIGRLTDMVPFRASGWELVVAGVSDETMAAVASRVGHVVRLAEGRYTLELSLDPPPERLVAELTGALNTFRESVRDKVLYNLVLFAVLLMAASYLIGQLTAGQDVKIIKDLGLSATATFGLFIAVFIGIGLVSKEVERRSVYALLAKPIHRYQLVLGKYAGLVLTLTVNIAVMAAGLYLVLAYMGHGVSPEVMRAWDAPALDPALLEAVALILVELTLVTAIAVFFSTFSTPILSAALTFGVYVVGHLSSDLRNFQDVVDSPSAARLARGLYWVLPNLAQFDIKADVVHGRVVPLGYLVMTLAISVLVFSRRDFR